MSSTASVVVAKSVPPFWNRLRQITLYPLHPGAMSTIVVLALCKLVVYIPFGRFLSAAVTIAMYKYAFECLRATANGFMEPPEIAQSVERSTAVKQIWLIVIFVLTAIIVAALISPAAGLIVGIALGFALPGATMTLAMEESLGAALNPGKWLGILARIGWPYFAVALLCLVVSFSQSYASVFVAMLLPQVVAIVAVQFVSFYGLVVTFHLMGYLLYQYHHELGFEPESPQLSRIVAKPDPDQEMLDRASALVQEGKPEDAQELLRGTLRARGGTPAVHALYRKLLRIADNNEELLRHGREYLSVLLAQEKDRPALELLRECQSIDPAFVPAEPGQITHLAQKAAQFGQPQVTLRLLAGFHKRYPKSKDVPQNYLLAASLLHERMNQDDQAIALLKFLKMTYPQHELATEFDTRLAMIEKIRSAQLQKA